MSKQSKQTIKAFVIKENNETKFTKNNVLCLCYELEEFRLFDKTPFFDKMKLFKGKNIWFEVEKGMGSMTIVCKESQEGWIKQLWNYYIIGKFTI